MPPADDNFRPVSRRKALQALALPAAILLLGIAAGATSRQAAAQARPRNLEPLPDIPPPPPPSLQLAPGQEPEVRIVRRDGETVEEYRIGGQLYMMKVTPAGGGTPFYLVDHFGDGVFARMSTYDTGVRAPMWVIRSW